MDFDSPPPVPTNAVSFESDKQLELDLSKVELRKFTVIGEQHIDNSVGEFVKQLIRRGGYASLYLEALYQGHYSELGDSLKVADKSVYADNPRKYDDIIAEAQKYGLKIYGIDRDDGERNAKVTDEWADYILRDPEGNKLILVGEYHALYYTYGGDPRKRISMGEVLPLYLEGRGVLRKDIFIISDTLKRPPHLIKGIKNGSYYPSELIGTSLEEIVVVRKPVVDLVRIHNRY